METYEQMFKRHEDQYREQFMARQKAYDKLVEAKEAEMTATGGKLSDAANVRYLNDIAKVTEFYNPILAETKAQQAKEASQKLDFSNQMQYNFKVKEQELAGNPLFMDKFLENSQKTQDRQTKDTDDEKRRNDFLEMMNKNMGKERGNEWNR